MTREVPGAVQRSPARELQASRALLRGTLTRTHCNLVHRPRAGYQSLAMTLRPAAACGNVRSRQQGLGYHAERSQRVQRCRKSQPMTARPKTLIAWSSGKDSAWALHEARRTGDYEIVGALTTVTDSFARVSMHGVREELLLAQLEAVSLPAIIVDIPFPCPN